MFSLDLPPHGGARQISLGKSAQFLRGHAVASTAASPTETGLRCCSPAHPTRLPRRRFAFARHLHAPMTSTRPALAVKNGVRPRCCDAGFPPYGPLSRRCRVPSVRAPGASSSLRAMPGARACRVRGSAHRLRSDAPLSGLDLPCFLRMLARRPSGPKRRRARAVSTRPAIPRANIRRKQARSSPDRGASERSR